MMEEGETSLTRKLKEKGQVVRPRQETKKQESTQKAHKVQDDIG